jgi:hypothetical protein
VKAAIQIPATGSGLIIEVVRVYRDQLAQKDIHLSRFGAAYREPDAIVDASRIDPLKRCDQTLVAQVEFLPANSKIGVAEIPGPTGLVNVQMILENVGTCVPVNRWEAVKTLTEDPGVLQLDKALAPGIRRVAHMQPCPGQHIVLGGIIEVEILLALISDSYRGTPLERAGRFLANRGANSQVKRYQYGERCKRCNNSRTPRFAIPPIYSTI